MLDKEKQHEYWKERNEQLYLNGEKKGLELVQALQKNYKQTIRNIQAEIYKLYGRYAKEGQIDLAETKKLLNKSELKTFKESTEDIAEYVKKTNDEDYKKKLKMLRIKSQVTRLEELKTNIEYELSKLTHKAEEQLREYLEEIYEDSYYRTIFNVEQNIGFAVSYTKPNQKQIEKAVSKQYQGVNYSTAIWNSKYTLFKILEQKIPQGLSAGWNPKKLAQIVDKQLNTGYNSTVRLIRTEYNLLMNEATADGYKTCGIEEYKILATLDNRTSDICQEMDLKVFDLKDKEVGINYPPFHPNCRTTTIPYFEPDEIDKEFGIGTRIARDENGKTYEVPEDMSYKEWKEKYVTNSNSSGIIDKNANKKEEDMKYEDITIKMYKNAKPKEGSVEKQNFIENNRKKYFVDGRNVVYKHDDREIAVARLLNETFGGDVRILPQINCPQGIKTPDYIFRGEKDDLKRIASKRVSDCVKTAIRDSERQAHNFIIDNTLQTVSDEIVISQIDEIYKAGKFSWVNTIYVLKDNKFIKVYKRK